MRIKRYVFIMLFLFLVFTLVPTVGAQGTSDVNINDIINALGPRTDGYPSHYLIFDIMLYLIFFLSLVSMMLIPDKQLQATMLNFIVLLLAVLSKVMVAPEGPIRPTDFPVLLFNAGMFVLPLLIAGMVRSANKYAGTPKALFTSIITGLLGGGYFFLFWLLEQKDYVGPAVSAIIGLS